MAAQSSSVADLCHHILYNWQVPWDQCQRRHAHPAEFDCLRLFETGYVLTHDKVHVELPITQRMIYTFCRIATT